MDAVAGVRSIGIIGLVKVLNRREASVKLGWEEVDIKVRRGAPGCHGALRLFYGIGQFDRLESADPVTTIATRPGRGQCP